MTERGTNAISGRFVPEILRRDKPPTTARYLSCVAPTTPPLSVFSDPVTRLCGVGCPIVYTTVYLPFLATVPADTISVDGAPPFGGSLPFVSTRMRPPASQ